MPTVSVNLDQSQYVKVNTGYDAITLQSLRGSVRITLSESKPSVDNVVYHMLSGKDEPLQFPSIDTNLWVLAVTDDASLIASETGIPGANKISTVNSTSVALTNGSTFTGEWEDVSAYADISVAPKTDQDGTYTIQFSPDGVNADSTLTRQYRTDQIEPPHIFEITRQYARVTFTNNSGSDQTFQRLQTIVGDRSSLNTPIDSTLAQDFDAIATRPTNYHTEVATGLRQGHDPFDKFGYNDGVPIGTELVAAMGGSIGLHTTASTFTVTSTNVNDTAGGTGCQSIIIFGINDQWEPDIEIIALDSTTPPVTTKSWMSYPNRVAQYLVGSGQVNAGDITLTRTTGGATVALMPAGFGVTQQCVFTIPEGYKFPMDWMLLNGAKEAGKDPFITFRMWVYSAVNNGKQEVFTYDLDTTIETGREFTPPRPFPIGEKSIVWMEATSDKADTRVKARFSGELIRNAAT